MTGFRFLIVVGIVFPTPVLWAANVNDFMDFSLRATNNSLLLPGRLYVPPAANTSSRPLILFLHGSGESGTNNRGQLSVNIDNLLAEAKQRGAYLLAPQTNSGWSPTMITTHIATMLDRAAVEQNVDVNRVYVTGLSMGGGGVWDMLNRYPERFAAAVPICGVAPASDFLAANLLSEPIWAFHARNDNIVPVARSRSVVTDILLAAQEPVPQFPMSTDLTTFRFNSQSLDLHYLELATGGHNIWPAVYLQEPMYDWMFSLSSVPEPSSLAMVAVIVFALATARRWPIRLRINTTGSPQTVH